METFAPCGTQIVWWVLAKDPLWQQLRNAHQALTTTPYEGIYVDLSGAYVGPATEEKGGAFSTDYDGLFRISALTAARKREASDCR